VVIITFISLATSVSLVESLPGLLLTLLVPFSIILNNNYNHDFIFGLIPRILYFNRNVIPIVGLR